MKNSHKTLQIITLLLLLLTAIPTQSVYAATWTVTNGNDSGAGSLRQAIADASAGDTITFNGDFTIALESPILLEKNLTIDGTGHTIVLDGHAIVVDDPDSSEFIIGINLATVLLDHLTIENGVTGIINFGTLTVQNSTISQNTGENVGGGIFSFTDSVLTIRNCTISQNSAFAGGGVYIYRGGTLTMENSIISGNSAFAGGGIAGEGTMSIDNTTIANNEAGSGGGILNVASSPGSSTLTIRNSTISGNTATNKGGGLYNEDSTLTLTNVTITGNTAPVGGGTYNATSSATIRNTIFWGNTGGEIYNDILSTSTVSDSVVQGGYSGGTNIIIGDPGLGSLGDYGGATQTIPLGDGSPAIDAGSSTYCPNTDQRGVSRPQGSACDIGAYEFGASILSIVGSAPSANTTITSPGTIEVSFSEDALHDGSSKAADNTSNYLLLAQGPNRAFDTTSCAAGLLVDDIQQTISTVTYSNNSGAGPFTATLNLNNPLKAGEYRLFICGTTSIWSAAGLELNNGASDTQVDFTVQETTSSVTSLPETGFRHGQQTPLSEQPLVKTYSETAMTLIIPTLGVSMPIVGVPQTEDGWDVTWLGDNAGYLAGSVFPTRAGTTVITGHVWDAYNRPGPFAEIRNLVYGDRIQIHAWGATYTYEVRESNLVSRQNPSAVFQSEEYDWVTLVTCEGYNPFSGAYLFRRVVSAVLVKVQ